MFLFQPQERPPDIGKLKAREDIPGLIEALNYEKDINVRKQAAAALDKLGWLPDRSEAGAAYWLAKGDWNRCTALGDPAARPLIAALKYHAAEMDKTGSNAAWVRNRDAALASIRGLAKIGEGAVDILIDALSDKDVYEGIAVAMIKIGAPTVQPLLRVLRYADEADLKDIARLLDRLGWHPGKNEHSAAYWIIKGDMEQCVKLGELAVRPLIASFRHKFSLRLRISRRTIIEALVEIGVPAVEYLIHALNDKNENVREGAAETLGKIGTPRAVQALQQFNADRTRLPTTSIENLIDTLQDDNWRVRRATAEALGILGSQHKDPAVCQQAAQALEKMIKDSDDYVRQAVLAALAKIGDPRLIKAMAGALKDKERNVRSSAVYQLANFKHPEAFKAILSALKDEDAYVRQLAIETLVQFEDPAAVKPLINMLRDSDRGVVAAAIWGLTRLADGRAVKPIFRLMLGKDVYSREVAAEALVELALDERLDEENRQFIMSKTEEMKEALKQRRFDLDEDENKEEVTPIDHLKTD